MTMSPSTTVRYIVTFVVGEFASSATKALRPGSPSPMFGSCCTNGSEKKRSMVVESRSRKIAIVACRAVAPRSGASEFFRACDRAGAKSDSRHIIPIRAARRGHTSSRLRFFSCIMAPLPPFVLASSANAILTTVNDNCLAGDECRIVAGQKKYGTCHILGFSQPLNRLLFPRGAFLLFRLGRGCQRICQAGQHRVRGNAVVCNVICQTSHEPDDSHLCS